MAFIAVIRTFPRVQVEVHCEPSMNLRRLLAEDRLDLAVTVLSRSILPAEVRPLRAEEGFPPLPTASITLHRGHAVSAVAEGLAGYLRKGFAAEALPTAISTVGPSVMA